MFNMTLLTRMTLCHIFVICITATRSRISFLSSVLCILELERREYYYISDDEIFSMHPVRHDEHEESRKRSASLYPFAKLRAPKSELLYPLPAASPLDIRPEGLYGEFASSTGAGSEKKFVRNSEGFSADKFRENSCSDANAVPVDIPNHLADGEDGRGDWPACGNFAVYYPPR